MGQIILFHYFLFKAAIKVQNISLEIRLSKDLHYLLYVSLYVSLNVYFFMN